MAKLTKMASALGSIMDLGSARAEFDQPARVVSDTEAYPPEEIRPPGTETQSMLLRITDSIGSQGDTFAVIHIPATKDFAAALVLNPSTQIESGQTFAAIADEGGWPVVVAMVEEFLGTRIDHVAELEAAALGAVVDELGGLQVYSRAPFEAAGTQFAEGTNTLTGATSAIFASADPIDDAGQTRTRNQRALLRALIQGLKTGGLAKNPNKAAAVLGGFALGIRHDAKLTTIELGKIANFLRQLQTDDLAVVTVPTNSRREADGTVLVDFDPEALPALKNALAGNDLPDFFRYLVSLGY
ncbi:MULTISPECIES: LCP family protein [unclassified Brevibacterium]|uniref:LCP family protein n=1 Tax=unclassified Brevibacterium TaxID=2614124 RepID=UPI001E584254|nr:MULTISPECIES: LCP family protein [unclassified Brevibacterium]MCD1287587.1 transcriptional regulator [Brevibacterium sp. CCUG 69071]MDK8436604.1 LCP family protein [Brevibacterium sp. H-BE7]